MLLATAAIECRRREMSGQKKPDRLAELFLIRLRNPSRDFHRIHLFKIFIEDRL